MKHWQHGVTGVLASYFSGFFGYTVPSDFIFRSGQSEHLSDSNGLRIFKSNSGGAVLLRARTNLNLIAVVLTG